MGDPVRVESVWGRCLSGGATVVVPSVIGRRRLQRRRSCYSVMLWLLVGDAFSVVVLFTVLCCSVFFCLLTVFIFGWIVRFYVVWIVFSAVFSSERGKKGCFVIKKT